MADIVAVLVVPAEGDPGGLTANGVCGSRPPLAVVERGWWGIPADMMRSPGRAYALPLWWDGALVPEGWDRLQRVVRREAQPLANHAWHPRIERVVTEAEVAVSIRVASRVVRLARVDALLVGGCSR